MRAVLPARAFRGGPAAAADVAGELGGGLPRGGAGSKARAKRADVAHQPRKLCQLQRHARQLAQLQHHAQRGRQLLPPQPGGQPGPRRTPLRVPSRQVGQHATPGLPAFHGLRGQAVGRPCARGNQLIGL